MNVAFALTFGAVVHQARGESQAARECADAAIALATEQVLPFWVATARIFRGWAWFREGNADQAIAEIERGLAENNAAGAEVGRPKHCGLLAEVFAAQGDGAAALAALAEAFEAVDATGGRYEEAELHYLRGETLLSQAAADGGGDLDAEAEACFRRGIEIARQQEARAFELRCATGLARLLHRRGASERGAPPARPALRVVHRGSRHRRPAGGAGAARRTPPQPDGGAGG